MVGYLAIDLLYVVVDLEFHTNNIINTKRKFFI